MSSRRVEDRHLENLERLLAASEVECIKPPREEQVEELESESEEQVPEEEEQYKEEHVAEEEHPEEAEKEEEELTFPFPTPSLRHVLSDKVRIIQQQNRIHVLPDELKTAIDPEEIPRIATTPPQKYIDILAQLVGCNMYKSSLAEYWFLDTLANLLRRAQEDQLDKPTQAILMLWFIEWMKEMQHFDAADRQRMMRRFQDTMLSAATFIAKEGYMPTPADADVYFKARDDATTKLIQKKNPNEKDAPAKTLVPRMNVTFGESTYECSLHDLAKIIHYIFDLFSTDYQYALVRSIFTFTPGYTDIDAPHQLRIPKRLYAPLKAKKEKTPQKERKTDKGIRKGKKEEEPPKDYLALMELKGREERELEAIRDLEKEDWNRKSHILPLNMAIPEDYLETYWPPPPPDAEVEAAVIAVTAEPKAKGRKKK